MRKKKLKHGNPASEKYSGALVCGKQTNTHAR
jgi:hypothetical protein